MIQMRYRFLVVGLLSFSSTGCGGSPAEAPRRAVSSAAHDEVEKNKAVVRRWTDEAHNKRNLAVADEIYTADYRGHMLSGDSINKEQGKQMELAFQAEFPTHRVTIDDLVGEGDRVVSRWTLSATHKSGKPVVLKGMSIARFANGKIAEEWVSMDNAAMAAQLAAADQPAEK
jgi:predicted ester cyclase